MLYDVRFTTRVITETDNVFPIDGFMNPTFHNEGATIVKINNQEVRPRESYKMDFPGCVLNGTANIDFKEEVGKPNVVIVNHGIVVGLHTNPQTGQILTEQERSSGAKGC
jgi:hypothetical protein